VANRTNRTAKKDGQFFAALACGRPVREALAASGYARTQVYAWRKAEADFGVMWDDAEREAVELMEAEADRRAVQGVSKPVFYQGQPSGLWLDAAGNPVPANAKAGDGTSLAVTFQPWDVREYSDTLLIFRLKALDPEKYRERTATVLTGKDGGPVQTEDKTAYDVIAQRIAAVEARKLKPV
jgi:hypothetical protein